jgi:hypothetical protein
VASERELVEGLFEAFNAEGGEAVIAYLREHDALSPDFRARVQPNAPNGGDWPGADGFRRMVEAWMEAWNSFRIVPREIEEVGEGRWLLRVTQVASSPAGADLEDPYFIYTCLFADGKLVRIGIWTEEDLARADLDAG